MPHLRLPRSSLGGTIRTQRNLQRASAFFLPRARQFSHSTYLCSPDSSNSDYDYSFNTPRRIYILGTGSVGKLVAHSLRSVPNPPPVSLLFHKPSLIEEWRDCDEKIRLTTAGVTEERDGFDVELAMPNRREHGQEIEHGEDPLRTFMPFGRPDKPPEGLTDAMSMFDSDETESAQRQQRRDDLKSRRGWGSEAMAGPIYNLIVTTKAASTISAISAIRHRLTPESTICFLQNGMGIVEEVNETLFPEEDARPSYIQGIISHGVHSSAPFAATHAGVGTIQLGLLPRGPLAPAFTTPRPGRSAGVEVSKEPRTSWAPSARYLLRTLTRSPALCAVSLTPADLLCAQLEKLAVNCLVNPLTALLDVRNGALLYNFHLTRAMRLLLSEISCVIRALPELQGLPNLQTRFAPERLETLAVSVANKTGQNVSSMLADVRRGLRTEVDYINGYIVRRGEQIGIRCVMNYLVMNLVNGKQNITQREVEEDVTLLKKEDEVAFGIGEGSSKRK